jgi:hypothetical protein
MALPLANEVRPMNARVVIAVALAAIALAATAQEQPQINFPSVPPNNCVKPELPGSNATQSLMRKFNENYKTYGECIKKYIDGAKALADAALAAGNAAVGDYNKLTEEIKAHNEAINK